MTNKTQMVKITTINGKGDLGISLPKLISKQCGLKAGDHLELNIDLETLVKKTLAFQILSEKKGLENE